MRTKSRLHAVDITSRSGEPSPFMHPRAADALAIAALTREPRPPALDGSAVAARSFLILLMVPILVLGGMFGYRWMFSATPVTQEAALQMFRAQSGAVDAPKDKKDETKKRQAVRSQPVKSKSPGRSRVNSTVAAAAPAGGAGAQTRHTTAAPPER